MASVLLALTLGFGALLLTQFAPIAVIYLSAFSAIPAALSIDLGPSIPLISLTRLLTGTLVATYLVRSTMNRTFPRLSYLMVPLGLLGLGYVIGLAFSSSPNGAGVFRLWSYLFEDMAVYIVALSLLTTEQRTMAFITGLTIALFCTEVYALYELTAHRNPLAELAQVYREGLIFDYSQQNRFGLPRLQSVFRNPLDFGVFIQLTLPFTAVLASTARHRRYRVLGAFVLLLGFPVALFTGSRMVIYSLIMTLAVYVVLRRQWKRAGIVCAVLLLGTVVIQRVTHFPILDYLVLSATRPELYASDVGGSSLDGLVRISGEHLRMLSSRPLTGWGPGTLPPNPAGEGLDSYWTGFGEQGITYLGAELGILGLLGIVAVYVLAFRRSVRSFRRGVSVAERRLGLAVACTTVGYAVSMQLEGSWHFALYLSLVAVLWAKEEASEVGGRRMGPECARA
jgi:hypothetical protein